MAKVTIVVDGVEYRVEEGRNLLQACLDVGLDLPYFCWHPALGSVGACRQCAVTKYENDDDDQGQIVMACMTPAEDGARISIADDGAVGFRARIIEWLMVNHPHDCPVCDEGGECHLQDMTVMSGHVYRRHRFPKRTHRNQYLGPFVHHEMNRCIQCYRCVRFYRDYAGGDDLDVFGAHDHVYFGRVEDGVLGSQFAGNLVEVCPTGVFTDKTLRHHFTRKWDLEAAPSVCVHCGLGCNITAGARQGLVRRVLNRYNSEVNGYFLCDRGRFGYEFVNHDRRMRIPLDRRDDVLAETDRQRVAAKAIEVLAGCDRVLGIGSPRASLETNFALRSMVGAERFCGGLTRRQTELAGRVVDIMEDASVRVASLSEVESADAVLILGEDLGNTAPRAELAVRQAVRTRPMKTAERLGVPSWHDAAVRDVIQDRRGPLYIATPAPTGIDGLAATAHRAAPVDIARLGFAVAHHLDGRRRAVEGLDDVTAGLAREIADALREAARPLVVAGSSLATDAVPEAARAVVRALDGRAAMLPVVPECNTVGSILLGGGPLEDVLEAIGEPGRTGIVIVENDLFWRDQSLAEEILEGVDVVIVIDHIRSATAESASVALPAATFAESTGTLVNNEGRAQRFVAVMPPEGEVRESWRWIADIMRGATGEDGPDWKKVDDVIEAIVRDEPALARVAEAAPGADFRISGQRVPRQPPRASGRTALTADRDVREQPPRQDPDSPLAFSMEGSRQQPPAALVPFTWSPGWNSVQAVNTFQEKIGGRLRGGPAGVRLLDAGTGGPHALDVEVPAPFALANDRWLALPNHHVFGSDELSRLAAGVRELAPEPYLGLAAADADRLGVENGDTVTVEVAGRSLDLVARIRPGLVEGTVLVPTGLDGIPAVELPQPASLRRGGGAE